MATDYCFIKFIDAPLAKAQKDRHCRQKQDQNGSKLIFPYSEKISSSRPMVLRSVFAKNIGTIVISLFYRRVVSSLFRIGSSLPFPNRPR